MELNWPIFSPMFLLHVFLHVGVYWIVINIYSVCCLQIGEEKATVIGLMRKAIAQQFTDDVSLPALLLTLFSS